MSHTQTGGSGVPACPQIPSGKEIYRSLMVQVEPDLLESKEELDTRYAGESPADHQERLTRYREAIEKYQELKTNYFRKLGEQVGHYCHAYLKSVEAESRVHEAATLQHLEEAIDSLPA